MLSLGTGVPSPKVYDVNNWNLLSYNMMTVELMIDIDVYMADE